MKGLDWFQVQTDIAWDNDIEHCSDAEFRTFFELIAISAYHLSDGVVPLSMARKHLNTRRVNDTLRALSAQGYINLDADNVTINNYGKYQRTREEVETRRAVVRERVARYREGSNAPKSKSKSKRKEDILVSLCMSELPTSQSTEGDYARIVDKYRPILGDAHIERIIYQLGGWDAKKLKERAKGKLHLTLASWLSKEKPQQQALITADDELESWCNM